MRRYVLDIHWDQDHTLDQAAAQRRRGWSFALAWRLEWVDWESLEASHQAEASHVVVADHKVDIVVEAVIAAAAGVATVPDMGALANIGQQLEAPK